MSDYESLPILYALDKAGVLRHVDEVPNGLACGCSCPDPGCGQELVARNAGKKRIHHFAHRRGSCEWSVEYVLASLALDAVTAAGAMTFPALVYHDAMEGGEVQISPARKLRVSSASLDAISGRGAPELMVTCSAGDVKKRFAVVVSLVHSLKDGELERLASAGLDVVLVDLRASLRARKRAEGKHFDRAAIVAGYQDRRFVDWLMLDQGAPFKSWAANSKRASAEEESAKRKRAWLEERERKRRERERAAAEIKAQRRLEEERRRALLEKQLAERRAAEEAKEAERRAQERAAQEQAKRFSQAEVAEQLRQQEHQVRDALGRRWVVCEKCGKAKLVDEFRIYGGAGRINLGICYDCEL